MEGMVPGKRLELLHLSALEPKSSASTNSATRAGEGPGIRAGRIIHEVSAWKMVPCRAGKEAVCPPGVSALEREDACGEREVGAAANWFVRRGAGQTRVTARIAA